MMKLTQSKEVRIVPAIFTNQKSPASMLPLWNLSFLHRLQLFESNKLSPGFNLVHGFRVSLHDLS